MFISRLAAKRKPSKSELDDPIYICNVIDPENRFKKYSINDIIKHIITETNGRINISPTKFFQRITDDDVSQLVSDYIYLGKHIDKVEIYSPWKKSNESIQTLSRRCNISVDALWGIYSSSKQNFFSFINKTKNFIDKYGPLKNNITFSILEKSFSFNLSTLLSKLHNSPGKYYKKFINTAIEQELNEEDTIKYLFLDKYKTTLANIEKKLKINGQLYTFDQLTGILDATSDEIKLFIIFDNINNEKIQIKPFIEKITRLLDDNDDDKFFINGRLMTIEDIARALKTNVNTIQQYKEEQDDQFELFIEEKLNGKLEPDVKYLTINNQDYTFDQIAEKFRNQGYIISVNDLNNRFDQILQAKNENYNKALKEMSKIVKEQLTGKKPFDFNRHGKKIQASRLRRKLYL